MSDNLRFYTDDHEWVEQNAEDNAIVTIGISQYAANELGEIVYVDLNDLGDNLTKGDELGSLESVKTVSGVYSPLSGEIVGVNEAVVADCTLVNDSPEQKGWLIKLKVDDLSDLEDMMSAKDYATYCATQ